MHSDNPLMACFKFTAHNTIYTHPTTVVMPLQLDRFVAHFSPSSWHSTTPSHATHHPTDATTSLCHQWWRTGPVHILVLLDWLEMGQRGIPSIKFVKDDPLTLFLSSISICFFWHNAWPFLRFGHYIFIDVIKWNTKYEQHVTASMASNFWMMQGRSS